MTVARAPEALRHRHLLDPSLWPRVSARIAAAEGVGPDEADAILDATIGFLMLSAAYPHEHFAPSAPVDAGWHAFLMYTRGYRAFCLEHAGRMIDHEPADGPGSGPAPNARDTVRFMRERGVAFDVEQWPALTSAVAACGTSAPVPGDGGGCRT